MGVVLASYDSSNLSKFHYLHSFPHLCVYLQPYGHSKGGIGLLSHRLGHGFKLQYVMTCVNALTELNNAYVTECGMVY